MILVHLASPHDTYTIHDYRTIYDFVVVMHDLIGTIHADIKDDARLLVITITPS